MNLSSGFFSPKLLKNFAIIQPEIPTSRCSHCEHIEVLHVIAWFLDYVPNEMYFLVDAFHLRNVVAAPASTQIVVICISNRCKSF